MISFHIELFIRNYVFHTSLLYLVVFFGKNFMLTNMFRIVIMILRILLSFQIKQF
uniref:Uncharacterized protein n=1 Tax=virus sp. ctviY17 TaxID=2825828 RepID=A0A8S5RLY9_9VIRU|nr:MAG TPA: hypothetical protein [virus sp. ctviY17]